MLNANGLGGNQLNNNPSAMLQSLGVNSNPSNNGLNMPPSSKQPRLDFPLHPSSLQQQGNNSIPSNFFQQDNNNGDNNVAGNNGSTIAPKLNSLLTAPQGFKAGLSSMLGGANMLGGTNIPTVLQSLLSKQHQQQQQQEHAPSLDIPTSSSATSATPPAAPNLAAVGNIVSKFTRCHYGDNGKESIQCLICSKWFAVPPVKHLRGHMVSFKDEKRRVVSLIGGNQHVCIICYDVFDDLNR